jgi:hypothetical protein
MAPPTRSRSGERPKEIRHQELNSAGGGNARLPGLVRGEPRAALVSGTPSVIATGRRPADAQDERCNEPRCRLACSRRRLIRARVAPQGKQRTQHDCLPDDFQRKGRETYRKCTGRARDPPPAARCRALAHQHDEGRQGKRLQEHVQIKGRKREAAD